MEIEAVEEADETGFYPLRLTFYEGKTPFAQVEQDEADLQEQGSEIVRYDPVSGRYEVKHSPLN